MASETKSGPKTALTERDCVVWTLTATVVIILICCVAMVTLTATGYILNDLSFVCPDEVEFVSWRKRYDTLVFSWAGLTFLACIFILLETWRKDGHTIKTIYGATGVLTVVMLISLLCLQKAETKEIQQFRERYLTLSPNFRGSGNRDGGDPTCSMLTNVHSWQTQFQCCGLKSHEDWRRSVPDSCLCDRGTNGSGCVEYKGTLVHETPCLPTVTARLEEHNALFWIIMIVWISVVSLPLTVTCVGLLGLMCYVYTILCKENDRVSCKTCCSKKRIPVVFINSENNNQVSNREESSRDVVLNQTDGANEEEEKQTEGESEANPVMMITPTELSRLQEVLHPPPVHHRVKNGPCLCIMPPSSKIKDFYTIWIEEGSPFLPEDAILVDAHVPMKVCQWERGHRYYDVRPIVWPNAPQPEAHP